ncbi:unnamed protein product [Oikopleura dioica]|uniref:Uncharacterized protein n=2 Tax=Oikopleura dioica TaxID=34765 RepID=E4XPH1_OIKDI|nr:unnamed protein product [Oikopleura dioica]
MKLSKKVVEVARGDGMRRPFNRFVREIVDTAEEDQPRILQVNMTDQELEEHEAEGLRLHLNRIEARVQNQIYNIFSSLMDDYVAQGRADSFPGFRDSLYAWTREYFNMRLAESELRDDELILEYTDWIENRVQDRVQFEREMDSHLTGLPPYLAQLRDNTINILMTPQRPPTSPPVAPEIGEPLEQASAPQRFIGPLMQSRVPDAQPVLSPRELAELPHHAAALRQMRPKKPKHLIDADALAMTRDAFSQSSLGNLDNATFDPTTNSDQLNDTFAHGHEQMIPADDNEESSDMQIFVNHHDRLGRIQTTTPLNVENGLITEKCDDFVPEFCDDFSHAMRLVRLVFEKHILAVENFNAEMQNEFAGVVLQTPRNFLPIGKVSIETRHQRPL